MNLRKLFRGAPAAHSAAGAHMTWGQSSIGRTVSRTGVFLKQQLWIWPIIATILLATLAFGVRRAIEVTMKSNLRSQLQTLLSIQAAMVENWCRTQEANASSLANDEGVRKEVYALLKMEEEPADGDADRRKEIFRQLRSHVNPVLSAYDYTGYLVTDRSRKILASTWENLIGQESFPEYDWFLSRALNGTPCVSPPFASQIPLKNDRGEVRLNVPTMFACAPIRNNGFEIVGALAVRIRPEVELTKNMRRGQFGASGETYAINQNGVMVSGSRFDESLILLGVLPDQPGIESILNVHVRDPQQDMTQGYRPQVRRSELPMTFPVEQAVSGKSGVDVEGYRDYRGVPSVGAWTWLPKEELGIIAEVDAAEAFRPLTILQRTFWGLYALLGISSLAIFIFTVIVTRLRREAQKAEIEARQLGQYTLDEKLGSGGMGVVYKGHHAMLRRPTAIKLLDIDRVNESSIQRFEREVQITCQLNHPNTIAIYDFGRTPEGVFYYAMEYLDGISLQTLVDRYGPQPEARVIHILEQVCGSLHEAHLLNLVHRDIKPANIMLNRRGGESDVVKVLDFGLVKAVDEDKQSSQTAAGSLTGTPLYMAPEAIQSPASVDGRSDLYAVGAVGYFLLTGRPVFEAGSIVELCRQHVDVVPIPPSQRTGAQVSRELEDAVMSCLEKSRVKRPHNARDLALLLQRSPLARSWSLEDADAWWGRHDREKSAGGSESRGAKTAPFDRTIVGDQDKSGS